MGKLISKFRVLQVKKDAYLCPMLHHTAIEDKLGELIREGEITLGGYKKTKIYGLLTCSSGKRMKKENRVFFKDEKEAIAEGYRPCGHCLPQKYKQWKDQQT